MSEDKKLAFRGEIDEKDIEKANLRSDMLDDVAGGAGNDPGSRPWNNAPDMENRIPVRSAPDLEGLIPARNAQEAEGVLETDITR